MACVITTFRDRRVACAEVKGAFKSLCFVPTPKRGTACLYYNRGLVAARHQRG